MTRSHQRLPLADLRAVPQRAVLVLEQDEVAVGRGARGAARFVQQHQRQQARSPRDRAAARPAAGRAGSPRRTDRARQRSARGRRIAFVEDEIDDVQHVVEPARAARCGAGDLVGDAASRIFALARTMRWAMVGARREEGARDLLGGQPADLAQRQRDLRIGRSAGWQQVKISRSWSSSMVLSSSISGSSAVGFKPYRQLLQRGVEARPAGGSGRSP